MTDLSTQAARDAAPTVTPVVECYALLRNGEIFKLVYEPSWTASMKPFFSCEQVNGGFAKHVWPATSGVNGTSQSYDIIAVYTPAQLHHDR
jgi:hypothetical protein